MPLAMLVIFCFLAMFSLFFLAVLGLHCSSWTLSCHVQASTSCSAGTSFCGAWALECRGSVAVAHGLSFPTACGISVPWPGIKPASPALAAWSLYHRLTREVPSTIHFHFKIQGKVALLEENGQKAIKNCRLVVSHRFDWLKSSI